jgi:hypothetical protein
MGRTAGFVSATASDFGATMLRFLDAYALRARLFPVIIGAAPALAALTLLISWKSFQLSNIVATVGMLVVIYALADWARRQGRRIEPRLYEQMGGKPSVTMMSRADTTIDSGSKDRYRSFLAAAVKRPAPTEADELLNPAAASAFYELASTWLREHTRDTKQFPILFNENVTYGFRRNLLGLKWPALFLNVVVVAICAVLLRQHAPVNLSDDLTRRVLVVLVVAAIHALYIGFVVGPRGVMDAARTYARQLILSCETFLARESASRAPTRRRTRRC